MWYVDWHEKVGNFLFFVGRCYLRSGSPRRLKRKKEKKSINPIPIAYNTLRNGVFLEKFSGQRRSWFWGQASKYMNLNRKQDILQGFLHPSMPDHKVVREG